MPSAAQRTVLPMFEPPARRTVSGSAQAAGFRTLDPCANCPLAAGTQVPPLLPPRRRVTVVGLGPWTEESRSGIPFSGESGQLLRAVLVQAGLDPKTEVGYANLGRCQPAKGFDSPEWARAEQQCWYYLSRDLAGGSEPLLLLGSRPLQRFLGDAKASVKRFRGLWRRTSAGREVFVAQHPAALVRERDAQRRAALEAVFAADIHRMANRLLRREQAPKVRVELYPTPEHARAVLAALARRTEPWFFDLETFDAQEDRARSGVATDPFHPDFRVRGVAVATGPTAGFWVELAAAQDRRPAAAAVLGPAFGSEAEKGAFVSGFDVNGLVVPGWVPEVRNMTRDPWLAAIALDTVGGGHSLERLVVDVLGEPQPVGKEDRALIRTMTVEQVAAYAVADACLEWRLDAVLAARLARGEYL